MNEISIAIAPNESPIAAVKQLVAAITDRDNVTINVLVGSETHEIVASLGDRYNDDRYQYTDYTIFLLRMNCE